MVFVISDELGLLLLAKLSLSALNDMVTGLSSLEELSLDDLGHGYDHLCFTSHGAWLHEQVSGFTSLCLMFSATPLVSPLVFPLDFPQFGN
jgi:hypothetical protein